ncbi:MAG: tRNA preQ1(34) S-adenosylmethionine ribosyltransferase-isomerase QueA [Verrucomicrobiota bacterium]|jgi:S-adenosylmethionine:tRNA ribosyltransferase-isomerase
MRTAEFNFALPAELIAQTPSSARDQSRLLVLERIAGKTSHRRFVDLPEYLQPNDVLVLNDSRVIPARLRGRNVRTGGNFEVLLLEENATNDWWAMLRPGKRARPGAKITIIDRNDRPASIVASVLEINAEGHRRLLFSGNENVLTELEALGEVPLPPYIDRPSPRAEDRDRYQTVFARVPGSVAAPTAGLHFTPEFLEKIRGRGVKVCFITLHVGPGTFAPVKAAAIADHIMHEERYEVGTETARLINEAGTSRVIAVGTTTMRVLESLARDPRGRIVAGAGRTRIFIYPPCQFKIVDGLVTNFHLPRSTLLMLVSAFAAPGETRGRELILGAYQEAIDQRYRFFSYGDAMLII